MMRIRPRHQAPHYRALLGGALASALMCGTALAAFPPYVSPVTGDINLLTVAKGDGLTLTDVTTTASSPIITSASHCFLLSDLNKVIAVSASSTVASLNAPIASTTIQGVTGCAATLATAPTASVSGTAVATFGTDDSAAIAALAQIVSATGGGIFVPARMFIVANPIPWASRVHMHGLGAGVSIFKWISPSDLTLGMFYGLGSLTAPYVDDQFQDFEIDEESATLATYTVNAKAFRFQFMTRPLFSGLYVHGSPASGVGTDYLAGGRITNNVVANCGRKASSGAPGGSGIGVGTYGSNYPDGSIIADNTVYEPTNGAGNYGIFVESQVNQSVASSNRITGNVVYLYGAQRGIASSGVFGTLIEANQVVGSGAALSRGISIDLGTLVTATADQYGKTLGNIVSNVDVGIYYDGSGSAQYSPASYTFEHNTVFGNLRYGYWLHSGASIQLDGVTISGGTVYGNGSAGVYADGTAGFKNLDVEGLKAFKNGLTTAIAAQQAGISVAAPVAKLTMHGDTIYDDGGAKQLYGLITTAAITAADITSNNLTGNVTGALQLSGPGSVAGWIADNQGYNPLGAVSITPTASPWTYTAGNTPETLYLSGGTITSVAKGGVAIASPVSLEPSETVVVTYAAAPTAVADRR